MVSTTVAKCAISQKCCDKQGHSCGFFTQKQGNSSHFIDGMSLVDKAELLALENIQCAQELGHSHFLKLHSCLQTMLWLASSLYCCQGFSQKKELACGTEREQLVTNIVCWQLYPSGEKKNGNFLSRGYSHTLNSCWQHRGNPRRECSQKWFFSCLSAPSKQTFSGCCCCQLLFPCCGWRPVSVYFWWWRRLKQKGGLGLLRFL